MTNNEMYIKFQERLKVIMDNKRHNCCYLTRQKYSNLVKAVKIAKCKDKGKQPNEYRLLKRYDVLAESGIERLVTPSTSDPSCFRFYVRSDELFKIIHEAHIKIGHGGRTKMVKELSTHYKNVTTESIMLYLDLCKVCQKKNRVPKKGNFTSTLFREMNSRCQVDIIDMEDQKDGEYQFIFMFQDYLTKFIILQPLKSKCVREIAYNLVDIFTTFGAPLILQSGNGREFAKEIVEQLVKLWPDLKMVHGELRHSENHVMIDLGNHDIRTMVNNWLQEHSTDKWSEGLRFIQIMKNSTYHTSIKCSPFEATFGYPAKIGLKSFNLPENIIMISKIKTEEELEQIIDMLKPSYRKLPNGEALKKEEEIDSEEVDNSYDKITEFKTEHHGDTEIVEVILGESSEEENTDKDDGEIYSPSDSVKLNVEDNKTCEQLLLEVANRRQAIKEKRRISYSHLKEEVKKAKQPVNHVV